MSKSRLDSIDHEILAHLVRNYGEQDLSDDLESSRPIVSANVTS